jgi:hypothetical protein
MKEQELSARVAVHELLYVALIDMREQARGFQEKAVYHICDLLHVVPKMLVRAANGECSYEEILECIRRKAAEKGYEKWVDHNLDQITRMCRGCK